MWPILTNLWRIIADLKKLGIRLSCRFPLYMFSQTNCKVNEKVKILKMFQIGLRASNHKFSLSVPIVSVERNS